MSASRTNAPDQPSDDPLDEALEETFPASDPIAVNPEPSSPEPPEEKKKHGGTHPDQD